MSCSTPGLEMADKRHARSIHSPLNPTHPAVNYGSHNCLPCFCSIPSFVALILLHTLHLYAHSGNVSEKLQYTQNQCGTVCNPWQKRTNYVGLADRTTLITLLWPTQALRSTRAWVDRCGSSFTWHVGRACTDGPVVTHGWGLLCSGPLPTSCRHSSCLLQVPALSTSDQHFLMRSRHIIKSLYASDETNLENGSHSPNPSLKGKNLLHLSHGMTPQR